MLHTGTVLDPDHFDAVLEPDHFNAVLDPDHFDAVLILNQSVASSSGTGSLCCSSGYEFSIFKWRGSEEDTQNSCST